MTLIDLRKPGMFYLLAVDARIKLGNRSTLEWVLDQLGEEGREPTIADKFNTYRFAD